MTLANGIQRYKEDDWTYGRFAEVYDGVVGLVYKHIYSVKWDVDLATLLLVEGKPMPDRPDSGDGSTATITSVQRGVKEGTSRELITVNGFEAKAWE